MTETIFSILGIPSVPDALLADVFKASLRLFWRFHNNTNSGDRVTGSVLERDKIDPFLVSKTEELVERLAEFQQRRQRGASSSSSIPQPPLQRIRRIVFPLFLAATSLRKSTTSTSSSSLGATKSASIVKFTQPDQHLLIELVMPSLIHVATALDVTPATPLFVNNNNNATTFHSPTIQKESLLTVLAEGEGMGCITEASQCRNWEEWGEILLSLLEACFRGTSGAGEEVKCWRMRMAALLCTVCVVQLHWCLWVPQVRAHCSAESERESSTRHRALTQLLATQRKQHSPSRKRSRDSDTDCGQQEVGQHWVSWSLDGLPSELVVFL